MKRKEKVVSVLLSGLLAVSFITACGSWSNSAVKSEAAKPAVSSSATQTTGVATGTTAAATSAVSSSGKTTVRVQMIGSFQMDDATDPVSGGKITGIHAVKEEFEKEHPDIQVEYVLMGWDDYQKKTQSMMISGEADVYQAPGISALAEQGLLEPLQHYIDSSSFDTSVYIDGQIDGWKVVGPKDKEPIIYGLPVIGDTRAIVFDKQLFDDWGVEYLSAEPSLEEVIEKGAKMTGSNPKTGKKNYGLYYPGKDAGDVVMNINEYYGGTWGSGNRASELKVNFNTDTMNKAMNALLEINKCAPEGVMSTQGGEAFGTVDNNVAIQMRSNPAVITNINALKLGSRYGVARLFVNKNIGKGGLFAGSPVVIAANSKVKDAAWEYVKFTASEFYAKYFWENQKNEGLPVIKAAMNFKGIVDDANVTAEMKSMQYLWTPRYVYRSGQGRSILTTAVEDVALNGKDIAEVLANAQKEVDDWISAQ